MKSRISLIVAASAVLLFVTIWMVCGRGRPADVAITPAMAVASAPTNAIDGASPLSGSTSSAIATQVGVAAPVLQPAAVAEPAVTPAVPNAEGPQELPRPSVHIAADGTTNYTARDGDTVSQLAVALLGSDSKHNRDVVIAANASLQANPDRVLAGQSYSLLPSSAPADESAAATPEAKETPSAVSHAQAVAPIEPVVDQKSDSERKLKYTAQPGDSVAALAANLLGGDTNANRDAIISDNASLQRDPDHLVAGKTYNITSTNGLTADPAAPPAVAPTTPPDADEAARLSVGRVLRYTAQPGDTVSKLAIVLLGEDSKANRDAIINANRSLKQDPDHLVAGQTYSIAAPAANTITR